MADLLILRVGHKQDLRMFHSGFTQDFIGNCLWKYELGGGLWAGVISKNQAWARGMVWLCGAGNGGGWSVPVAEIGLAANNGYMRT